MAMKVKHGQEIPVSTQLQTSQLAYVELKKNLYIKKIDGQIIPIFGNNPTNIKNGGININYPFNIKEHFRSIDTLVPNNTINDLLELTGVFPPPPYKTGSNNAQYRIWSPGTRFIGFQSILDIETSLMVVSTDIFFDDIKVLTLYTGFCIMSDPDPTPQELFTIQPIVFIEPYIALRIGVANQSMTTGTGISAYPNSIASQLQYYEVSNDSLGPMLLTSLYADSDYRKFYGSAHNNTPANSSYNGDPNKLTRINRTVPYKFTIDSTNPLVTKHLEITYDPRHSSVSGNDIILDSRGFSGKLTGYFRVDGDPGMGGLNPILTFDPPGELRGYNFDDKILSVVDTYLKI
jgi:hypothetical protein